LWRNQIAWRRGHHTPNARSIPPFHSSALRNASEEINEAKMNLQDAAKETQDLWIFSAKSPNARVQREPIRQWSKHQVKEPNSRKSIHAIGKKALAVSDT
jgi:hypothetical protein